MKREGSFKMEWQVQENAFAIFTKLSLSNIMKHGESDVE